MSIDGLKDFAEIIDFVFRIDLANRKRNGNGTLSTHWRMG